MEAVWATFVHVNDLESRRLKHHIESLRDRSKQHDATRKMSGLWCDTCCACSNVLSVTKKKGDVFIDM